MALRSSESAPPFATAGDEVVIPAPWMLWQGEQSAALTDRIDDWDYATPIRVSRKVRLLPSALRNQCHIAADVGIDLCATWYSTGTRMRGRGAREPVPPGGEEREVRIDLELPGHELGGSVVLRTQLILAGGTPPANPLAARMPGSILWEDSHESAIEGSGGRFPVEIMDFGSAGWLPPAASWYLDVPHGELETPMLGGVRLLINSGSPHVVRAVTTPEPGPHAAAVRDAIRLDTCRALLRVAFLDGEFLSQAESYAEGSVGVCVRRLVRSLFPERELSEVARQFGDSPDELDASLQAALRVFLSGDEGG